MAGPLTLDQSIVVRIYDGEQARVVKWQTRSTQNRMPQGVRVQVPSWVQNKV